MNGKRRPMMLSTRKVGVQPVEVLYHFPSKPCEPWRRSVSASAYLLRTAIRTHRFYGVANTAIYGELNHISSGRVVGVRFVASRSEPMPDATTFLQCSFSHRLAEDFACLRSIGAAPKNCAGAVRTATSGKQRRTRINVAVGALAVRRATESVCAGASLKFCLMLNS